MKDFQKRVLTERDELNTKIERLDDFLNRTTFFGETLILHSQLSVMVAYRDILDTRIKYWETVNRYPKHEQL